MKRDVLGNYVGERLRFRGTFFYQSRDITNITQGGKKIRATYFLFKDVTCVDGKVEQDIYLDHIWIPRNKFFDIVGLENKDIISFTAIPKPYSSKGYGSKEGFGLYTLRKIIVESRATSYLNSRYCVSL